MQQRQTSKCSNASDICLYPIVEVGKVFCSRHGKENEARGKGRGESHRPAIEEGRSSLFVECKTTTYPIDREEY